MAELWLPIGDLKYDISNNGNIRNLRNKLLTPFTDPKGNRCVVLRNGKKRVKYRIDDLVQQFFFPSGRNEEKISSKHKIPILKKRVFKPNCNVRNVNVMVGLKDESNIEGEVWESLYLDWRVIFVSNKGRVKINGNVYQGLRKRSLQVQISLSGKQYNVCSLVYQAFTKKVPRDGVLVHRDHDIFNNCLENIEFVPSI